MFTSNQRLKKTKDYMANGDDQISGVFSIYMSFADLNIQKDYITHPHDNTDDILCGILAVHIF
jgi:hypothetical protein